MESGGYMWFVVLTNTGKLFLLSLLSILCRAKLPGKGQLKGGYMSEYSHVLPPCALMRPLQYIHPVGCSARDSQDPPVDPSRRVAYKLMIADLCRRPDVSYATDMNTGAQSQADQCHAGTPFRNLVGWVRLGCSHRFSGTKSMLLNISFDHPSPSSLCTSIIARCQGAGQISIQEHPCQCQPTSALV